MREYWSFCSDHHSTIPPFHHSNPGHSHLPSFQSFVAHTFHHSNPVHSHLPAFQSLVTCTIPPFHHSNPWLRSHPTIPIPGYSHHSTIPTFHSSNIPVHPSMVPLQGFHSLSSSCTNSNFKSISAISSTLSRLVLCEL